MHLVALVNPPTGRYAAAWRHPAAAGNWLSADFYADLARTLERGRFDMMFFPDALAVPEDHAGATGTTLRTGGKGAIHLDPLTLASAALAATTRIGVGATVSTTFVPPYAIARSMLSLDHLSGGRAAWNIVTSHSDAEARNFGLPELPPKDARYDHADRVVQTVLDLWDTWRPDALRLDAAGGVFADPTRVGRIPDRGAGAPGASGGPGESGASRGSGGSVASRGSGASGGPGGSSEETSDEAPTTPLSRGPLSLPASPQGRPVLMQAGASARGKEFAARWAEVVFVVADDADGMRALRTELRDRARSAGRDPDRLKVLPAIQPVAAATDAAAAAHLAGMTDLLDPVETLRYLARLLHAEHLDPDAPGADAVEAHRGATGSTGFEDMLIRACRRESLTVQQLADRQAISQLGPLPTGSPQTVADELCGLVETGAADGFVVMATVYPDSFDRFVEHVVPELQRRGHLRRDYAGPTLREHLGLR